MHPCNRIYAAIKKNELFIHVTAWVSLKIIMLHVLKDKLRYIKFLKSFFEQT